MPAIDATLSTTYYLNYLAGTIVDGACTLSAPDAAAEWTNNPETFTVVGCLNEEASNTLPNFLALCGVANQLAGTTNLSVHDALKAIINAI
jgi:hypothetical protein